MLASKREEEGEQEEDEEEEEEEECREIYWDGIQELKAKGV